MNYMSNSNARAKLPKLAFTRTSSFGLRLKYSSISLENID